MRRLTGSVVALAAGVLLAGASLAADEGAEYRFVGVKKCKMCHKKKASGNQFGIWQESRHAKAYEVLASEKAMEAAKKRGIENPQQAPECLKCHTTAFPVLEDIANQKITLEEGVSCESCHGPGSGYYKKATMKGLREGTIEAASVGLRVPDEKTCTQCHTPEGNPFYKEFQFDEFVEKIAHPVPKAPAAAE